MHPKSSFLPYKWPRLSLNTNSSFKVSLPALEFSACWVTEAFDSYLVCNMHAEWRLKVSFFGDYFWIFISQKLIILFMKSTKFPAKMHVPSLLRYTILTVLGQLLPRKIAPPQKKKLTLTQTLTLTAGLFSSGAIVRITILTNKISRNHIVWNKVKIIHWR